MTAILPSARRENTRQSFSTLLSVKTKTLGIVSKLCRVSIPKHSVTFIKFAGCQDQDTRQRLHTLPSVKTNTLGKKERKGQILWLLYRVFIRIHSTKTKHSAKKVPRIIEIGLFAECFGLTLGNASLCRVLHSAMRPIPPFLLIYHV